MRIEVKKLPQIVTDELKKHGYHKADISVEPREKAYLGTSSDGQREYLVVMNLETGESKFFQGSWGGSNMFVKTLVDDHDKPIDLITNMLVIQGSTGYRNFASIVVHPSNFPKYLESGETVELTDLEKQYIRALSVIGVYRQEEFNKIPRQAFQATQQSLLEKDIIKKVGKGYGLTTKGKNLRDNQKLTAY